MVFLPKFLRQSSGQVLRQDSGQALLVVVLVIVVVLTVGLSLASRSITNLRSSTDEADSQRAFSAAEAGVEQVLKTGSAINTAQDLGNNSQISQVGITTLSGDTLLLNNGNPIFQDDGADIWLTAYNTDATKLFGNDPSSPPWNGTLSIYFGTGATSCQDPALEVIVLSGALPNPRLNLTMQKYAFDACASRGNNFTTPSTGNYPVDGVNGSATFTHKVQISITNGIIARVIPLYMAGAIGVNGSSLPPQGKLITSTGTAGLTNQKVVRKVTFFQGYEGLPSEFFYSLFTPR